MRRSRHWSIRASAVTHMPSGLGGAVDSEADLGIKTVNLPCHRTALTETVCASDGFERPASGFS